MHEYTGENIFYLKEEYACISLISNKMKVIIIGGGKAGFIKCISFLKKGCKVTVVSKEFNESFKMLQENLNKDSLNSNLELIQDYYKINYILDKHIVIIAVDAEELIDRISKDCEEKFKLYLNCKNFKDGNFVNPIQRQTENIVFTLNIKKGSPKTSQFLAEKIEETLKDYDGLVEYVVELREKVKNTRYKNEILDFVSSDDFKFFYEKGVHEKVLKMFYGGNDFEVKNSYEKK